MTNPERESESETESELLTDSEGDPERWGDEDPRSVEVPEKRCAWCKFHPDDWDEDTDPIHLSTGEVLCSACIGDLREYKRTRSVCLFYPGHWFGDETNRLITDTFEELMDQVGTYHGRRQSNALDPDADSDRDG